MTCKNPKLENNKLTCNQSDIAAWHKQLIHRQFSLTVIENLTDTAWYLSNDINIDISKGCNINFLVNVCEIVDGKCHKLLIDIQWLF